MKKPKDIIEGHAELSKFLTDNGFRIATQTIKQFSSEGRGPPIYGRWGKTYLFLSSDALKWAKARMFGHVK